MSYSEHRKIRDSETWEGARRAWEAGETAQSVARRFDVGMDALWRRRAKEDWNRDRPMDRPPEPTEGWNRRAQDKAREFEDMLRDARELAELLAAAMAGGEMPRELPAWHLGYLIGWRAGHLGPEVAVRDRAWGETQPWADQIWDEAGKLRGQADMDLRLARMFRAEWRAWAGLPDGVEEGYP